MENWKDVDGFVGLYQVSNLGNVRSVTRYKKVLKPYIDKDGYRCVKLKHNGKEKHGRICRLVATAFVPNPNGKPAVNHKDMTRTNDKAENLEWCTAAENVRWSQIHGKYKGVNHKRVAQISNDGETIRKYESISEAARNTGAEIGNISKCLAGERKKAGGYIWRIVGTETATVNMSKYEKR